MPRERVQFENAAGEQLAGFLDLPTTPPSAFALFAHCFTCSKNLKAAGNISRSLNDAGIAVLRFDFTGLGESEGDFSDTTFSNNLSDLLAAAAFLEKNHQAPALLVGHSLGGTAVLQAAFDIPSAVAVATIASPATPEHVAALFGPSRADIESAGAATVDLGGRPFTIKRQFLDDLTQHQMPQAITGLRKALLIMHAPLDDTVEVENASMLFQSAHHPKSFISLDQADHLLSRNEDSLYAGRVLAAWASRYLDQTMSDDLAGNSDTVVARTRRAGFFTEINAAGHPLVADEPLAYGGTDRGPTPYGLLSAALASCTSMTLRMYADHKKYSYDSFEVSVEHNKIHATDCVDCETADGRVDEFQRSILMNGDFTPEQRERMLEIADRCPVHRTLDNEVVVRTSLAARPSDSG
jgi:putative redox protein